VENLFDSPKGEVKKFGTKSPTRQLAGNAQNGMPINIKLKY